MCNSASWKPAKGQFFSASPHPAADFPLQRGTDQRNGGVTSKPRAIERHVVYPWPNLLARNKSISAT